MGYGKARRLGWDRMDTSAAPRQGRAMTRAPRRPLRSAPAPTPGPTPGDAAPDPPPGWLGARADSAAEAVWFHAGAALAALHPVAMGRRPAVPRALLADRLALGAAVACLGPMGRREGLAGLRDAVHLRRPDEAPGPAGAVAQAWRGAVDAPVAPAPGSGAPLDRAAAALAAHLADRPGDGVGALIAAETALAAALGWPGVLPVLTPGLERAVAGALSGSATRSPRGSGIAPWDGPDLRLACARAAVAGAPRVLALAGTLARRAVRLRAVAPGLRSPGAGAAVALLLARDAVAPSLALSPMVAGTAVRLSDRAARRLCDRLVALGALRELTGRPSFRLYGL